MLKEARQLETEFERVACSNALPCLAKRLELSRLIRRMFEQAIYDCQNLETHHILRSDFVLDFFERSDLGPALIEKAFDCEFEGESNENYNQLMKIADKMKDKLKPYLPEISYSYSD